MEIGVNMVAAYVLNVVTIVLVYHGLFLVFREVYRRNLALFAAFLIFLSPFAYVLAGVRSLDELLWVLSLTPFYGIVVMMGLFTSWMIRFYSVAFGALALVHFLFVRRSWDGAFSGEGSRFEFFYDRAGKVRVRTAAARIVGSGKRRLAFVRVFTRYWHFVFVAVMVLALVSTLVVGGKVGLRNPSYQEVLDFVSRDKTDERPYNREWACAAFAEDFKSSANKAGWICGYVIVYFPDGRSHALNAFNSTDCGLVFIEPQSDDVVSLTVGEPYWSRAKYMAPDYNDTVLGYTIDWQATEAEG
jgi:hypothetical protein